MTPDAALADAVERWGIEVGDPFMGGQTAWVAPAGADAVVKVLRRHAEAEGEAVGLRAWAGDGAVRLLDAFERPDELVLLVERCVPGTPLSDLPEPERDEVIAALLRRLWRTSPPDDIPTLVDMCDAWADASETRACADVDPGLRREGLELFRSLPRSSTDDVLLCTDLHAGNVLAAQREPWLMIDPKPHVGDRTYDVVQHLLNCGRLRVDPVALVRRVASLCDIDPARLQQWLFARCVVEAPTWPAIVPVVALVAPR